MVSQPFDLWAKLVACHFRGIRGVVQYSNYSAKSAVYTSCKSRSGSSLAGIVPLTFVPTVHLRTALLSGSEWNAEGQVDGPA